LIHFTSTFSRQDQSNQNTKSMGAARTGKRYDESFKRDAVRLRQQAGR